jgi:hypothetical protein
MFIPVDAKFNFTQMLLMHLLCVDNFLLLESGLKLMLKIFWKSERPSAGIICNYRQPIKIE